MQSNSRNLPDVFLLAFLLPFITYHRVKFEKIEARFLHFYLAWHFQCNLVSDAKQRNPVYHLYVEMVDLKNSKQNRNWNEALLEI